MGRKSPTSWRALAGSVQFLKRPDSPALGARTPHSKRRQARVLRAHRRRDLMTRSQRAVRWLQPGLVVKRWMLTSGLGLMLALLGAAVWADLKPIYWILETLSWFLSTITTVLPREITGPLVLIIGAGLVLWGQSRSFGRSSRPSPRTRTPCWWMPSAPRVASTVAPTSWPSAVAPVYPPC